MMQLTALFHDCAEAFTGFTSLIQLFPSSHAVFAKHFQNPSKFPVCNTPIYHFFRLFYEVPNAMS